MLDSIQVKKRLAQRGFTDDQPEGLAEELATFTESNLVAKSDLEIFREELREDMDKRFKEVNEQFAEMDKQFAEVDRQFAEVKGQFAWWALRIVLAQGAVTAALLALYGFAA